MTRLECVRCGFEWEVAAQRKTDNFCVSCRAKRVATVDRKGDKCHPWLGYFAEDQITPVYEDGTPVKPGKRICGHTDCTNSRHIERRSND